jgi:hypothetical protein
MSKNKSMTDLEKDSITIHLSNNSKKYCCIYDLNLPKIFFMKIDFYRFCKGFKHKKNRQKRRFVSFCKGLLPTKICVYLPPLVGLPLLHHIWVGVLRKPNFGTLHQQKRFFIAHGGFCFFVA